uniref:FAS1 domain-containing protein n=1 Tax=Biomphalaria glabrata TaxID=6526 RepID=A0A2C9LMV6_BIOGL
MANRRAYLFLPASRFTVFAPSDEVFNRLPAGTLDSLKADANKLKSVIGYHVVLNTASTFFNSNAQDRLLNSATNQSIRINYYSLTHTQTAEGINITRKNIRVLNGVLHEIDGVLSPPLGNLTQIGNVRNDISTFLSLIQNAGLSVSLLFTADHSTTIFAPNDDAFKNVSKSVMDYLNGHPTDLAEVLRYHVVSQYSLYSIGMANSMSVLTADLHSENLIIFKDDSGNLSVNQAKILAKDISSVNGVIHIIDTVLIPPRVAIAIQDQGVVVGTILKMAWRKLSLIFSFIALSAAQFTQAPQLVDVLKAEGHYTIFTDLLQTTGYLSQLNSSSQFTVFAPSDEVFNRLPAGTLDSLKADANKLKEIIGYHVVLNSAYSFSPSSTQDRILTSAINQPVRINSYSLSHISTVEGVNITRRNVRALHGILHEIDGIMSPPLGNIVQIGSNRSDISTFESLITKAGLTTFFTTDHSTTIFVPNDSAFQRLSKETLDYLANHTSALADVLRYHVISQYSLYSIAMAHSASVPTADNRNLMIFKDASGNLYVNQAKILEKDISSVNGVVHIIDTVLIPPQVAVAIQDQGIVVG